MSEAVNFDPKKTVLVASTNSIEVEYKKFAEKMKKVDPEAVPTLELIKKIKNSKIKLEEWANQVLLNSNAKVLIFGNTHQSAQDIDVLISLLPSLKKAGVKSLVLEILTESLETENDLKKDLEEFNKSGKISDKLMFEIENTAAYNPANPTVFIDLLKKAYAMGIKIIAGSPSIIKLNQGLKEFIEKRIGKENPVTRETVEKLANEFLMNPEIAGRNLQLLDDHNVSIVMNLLKQNPNEKIAVFCGLVHNDRKGKSLAMQLQNKNISLLNVDFIDSGMYGIAKIISKTAPLEELKQEAKYFKQICAAVHFLYGESYNPFASKIGGKYADWIIVAPPGIK